MTAATSEYLKSGCARGFRRKSPGPESVSGCGCAITGAAGANSSFRSKQTEHSISSGSISPNSGTRKTAGDSIFISILWSIPAAPKGGRRSSWITCGSVFPTPVPCGTSASSPMRRSPICRSSFNHSSRMESFRKEPMPGKRSCTHSAERSTPAPGPGSTKPPWSWTVSSPDSTPSCGSDGV